MATEAGMVYRLAAVIALVVTSTTADILVTRSAGTTPDRFTLPDRQCDCVAYSAVDLADRGGCHCRCLEERSTFSLSQLQCVSGYADCEVLRLSESQTKMFTFVVLDNNKLQPSLPVEVDVEDWCSNATISNAVESAESWVTFATPMVSFQQRAVAGANATFLWLDKDDNKDAYPIEGKVVKILYECKTPKSVHTRCWTVKFDGSHRVTLSSTTSTPRASATQRTLRPTDFIWIVAVCIGSMGLAAILTVILACACCRMRLKNVKKTQNIRVERIDKNGAATSGDQSPQRLNRDSAYSRPKGSRAQYTRRPMFLKNGGRTATPRVQLQLAPPATRAGVDNSERLSPRPDLTESQNSATFTVNADQTLYQSRTKLKMANGHHNPDERDRYSAREKRHTREIRAARLALNQFEGARFEGRKRRSEHETVAPPRLFNSTQQKISRAEASILGIMNENKPRKKRRNLWLKKRRRDDAKRLLGSELSIDYVQFEPRDNGSDIIRPTSDLEEYGDLDTPSKGTAVQLNEYHIEPVNVVDSEEFYETNSRNNTARRNSKDGGDSSACAPSVSTREFMDSSLDVTVKFHGRHRKRGESGATLPRADTSWTPRKSDRFYTTDSRTAAGPVTDIDSLITSFESLPAPPSDL